MGVAQRRAAWRQGRRARTAGAEPADDVVLTGVNGGSAPRAVGIGGGAASAASAVFGAFRASRPAVPHQIARVRDRAAGSVEELTPRPRSGANHPGAKKLLGSLPYVGTAATLIWAGADIANGAPVGQTVAKTGGTLAGGLAGGAAGAKIGAVIGTFFFPGPGTAVGGVVGGVIGGGIGAVTGSGLAESIYNWFTGG